ncbi:hypothetical protein Heshes_00260 [Alicyclobacillus hesperidum]|uniref:Uncharacterized protein n=1 Tax=Alicyclobacillus hesperidum TaxID=89784 RepID=A0AA37U7U6_9BACL|nr:hypothetical protein Heshes_00260 [Alicyclobacillus hesperidum]
MVRSLEHLRSLIYAVSYTRGYEMKYRFVKVRLYAFTWPKPDETLSNAPRSSILIEKTRRTLRRRSSGFYGTVSVRVDKGGLAS